jgi:glycosyltransferase involved in cell wall biosynthesis
MACGLPVIVSRVAGCASDLIQEDWNGLLVKPKDIFSLQSAMANLARRPDLCANMGAHARQHIAQYSPAAWSVAIAETVKAITGTHD